MNSTETTPSNPFQFKRLWVWVVALLIIIFLGAGLQLSNAPRPEIGTDAPDFAVSFFDGYGWEETNAATLEQMQGSVVVLNFWAAWCVECRLEADLLQAYSEQYADQGVIFLGVAWTDTEPKSLAYLQEFGITYPNGPDIGLDIGDQYEITGVPETYFIDQDGVITQRIIGPVSAEILGGTLDAMLDEGS